MMISSIPGQPIMSPNVTQPIEHLEELSNSHVDGDAAARDIVHVEADQKQKMIEIYARITMEDLRTYGLYPAGCRMCEDLKIGAHHHRSKLHS